MRCQVPGCDAQVFNGHHCAAGHPQVRGVDPSHPQFRKAIPEEIRAKRCAKCGGFVPCDCGKSDDR
jgi:hypothetical protein